MNNKKTCVNCRWWEGEREQWGDKTATCSRIHVGGGQKRDALARVYPVGCSAWLETHRDFACMLFEPFTPQTASEPTTSVRGEQ